MRFRSKSRLSEQTKRKYELYELSVQSPETHVEWISRFHEENTGKIPLVLREDFCGTFALSRAWVDSSEDRRAIGLDLDPEPLSYGINTRWKSAKKSVKDRLYPLQQNVMEPVKLESKKLEQAFAPDTIAACNFSFFIFRKREHLKNYFSACARALKKQGTLVLEIAGGPGMIADMRETKRVYKDKKFSHTYVWDQKDFDPIQNGGTFAIHFRLNDSKKTWIKDAFTYDWRLWSIPEIRDLLEESGFSSSVVYWETEHNGKGTGEYLRMERGDNSFAWVAYVVGVKG